MSSLERDGVRIHYDAEGEGASILFSHGFCATGRMFASAVAALAPSHRCVTWDLRGHGESDYPDEQALYSPELTLGDMVAILDAEGVERAVLVGHSLGGYLSLAFELTHPERVAALVLVGTGPGFRKDEARAGWNDLSESYARAFEEQGFDGLPRGSEVEATSHRNVDGLIRAARGILPQRDGRVLEHLPEIDVPTLVIVGSKDRAFLGSSEYMAKKVPGARQVVIEGAGHAPMITKPDEFNTAVAGFLSSLS